MAWVGAGLNSGMHCYCSGIPRFSAYCLFTIAHSAKGLIVQLMVRTLSRIPWESLNRYPDQ